MTGYLTVEPVPFGHTDVNETTAIIANAGTIRLEYAHDDGDTLVLFLPPEQARDIGCDLIRAARIGRRNRRRGV